MESLLFKKIYGALIGSAIGDAMGGPVEGLHFKEIQKRFGKVDSLLPYNILKPSYHGPFDVKPGAYTDDTRMAIIFCDAAVSCGGIPTDKEIARQFCEYYYSSKNELEMGFIEEYWLKGIFREDKEAFGGQPTNGGVMGIAPIGLLFCSDPVKAFDYTFRNIFTSTGYARSATALAAAGIAAAMKPKASTESVVNDMLAASEAYRRRVDGSGWRDSHLYESVAVKSETLLEAAVKTAGRCKDQWMLMEKLEEVVVQQFFADASETLAIAGAMFTAAEGEFSEAIVRAVNFGRDNDSSACLTGALAGALNGVDGIPEEWVEIVEHNNPPPGLHYYASKLEAIILKELEEKELAVNSIKELI